MTCLGSSVERGRRHCPPASTDRRRRAALRTCSPHDPSSGTGRGICCLLSACAEARRERRQETQRKDGAIEQQRGFVHRDEQPRQDMRRIPYRQNVGRVQPAFRDPNHAASWFVATRVATASTWRVSPASRVATDLIAQHVHRLRMQFRRHAGQTPTVCFDGGGVHTGDGSGFAMQHA